MSAARARGSSERVPVSEQLDGRWSAERLMASLRGARGVAWLDADGSAPHGRYAYLACEPVETRRVAFGDGEWLSHFPAATRVDDGERAPEWIVALAYDAAWMHRAGAQHTRGADSPVLLAHRYDAVIELDVQRGEARLVGDDARAVQRLRARLAETHAPASFVCGAPSAADPAAHLAAVARAKEHIARGDVYQLNLARPWRASFEGSPLALFLAMRRVSPVPLGFFLDAGELALCARTMETFLAYDAHTRRLETRPIKGTLARSADDAHDARALVADDKERAEHAMIVDLMRNDLGRVAETGTVRVDEVMRVEPYARLHHLVSTVSCTVREGVDGARVVHELFPPGSVTGCPKERAIALIEALEPTARGFYTGCVGHVARSGDTRLAVSIRLATVARGVATYFAGGGIVSASDPERELAETELKARAFLDALSG